QIAVPTRTPGPAPAMFRTTMAASVAIPATSVGSQRSCQRSETLKARARAKTATNVPRTVKTVSIRCPRPMPGREAIGAHCVDLPAVLAQEAVEERPQPWRTRPSVRGYRLLPATARRLEGHSRTPGQARNLRR